MKVAPDIAHRIRRKLIHLKVGRPSRQRRPVQICLLRPRHSARRWVGWSRCSRSGPESISNAADDIDPCSVPILPRRNGLRVGWKQNELGEREAVKVAWAADNRDRARLPCFVAFESAGHFFRVAIVGRHEIGADKHQNQISLLKMGGDRVVERIARSHLAVVPLVKQSLAAQGARCVSSSWRKASSRCEYEMKPLPFLWISFPAPAFYGSSG